MKTKFINLYMDWAKRASELSYARRLHVGAVIVKDDSVISYGYNGMPAGWDNNCEDKEYMDPTAGGWLSIEEIEQQWPFKEECRGEEEPLSQTYIRRYRLKTKSEVLHAESNAISKLAKSSNSGLGADIFITHAPCIECAKLIHQSGIRRVFFGTHYRDDSGIKFLQRSGIEVNKIEG